jgi:putative membrane protein
MRTLVKQGVVAVAVAVAMLAVACAEPRSQPPRSSASVSEPQPQKAFNNPQPQKPILETPTAQAPIDNPEPQKPFYGPGTTEPEDRAQAKTEKPLSDAEILGVAMAANDGEVQMAEIAAKKATAPDVKQFAVLMKSSHQKALEKDKALQTKTKITSAESDASSTLKSETEKTIKELRDKQGKDFDRAYMDSQVKAHKDVLVVIDNRLVPSVKNGEVKAMLVEMRRTVADHLVKADDLHKKLEGSASTSQRDSSSKVGIGVPAPKEPAPGGSVGKHHEPSRVRTGAGAK